MCDETTESENKTFLDRRQLGLGVAGVMALTACHTRPPEISPEAAPQPAPQPAPPATTRREVTIATPDGQADCVFVTPTSGKHPGVLLWPDIAGLRKVYETMAERLASAGYAVLAINPYYRSAKRPILSSFDEWRTEEGRNRMMPMYEALTSEAVARDGAAFAAWLDRQAEVDTLRKLGAQGYCMSGPFTLRLAAAVPDRVGAIASFHGGGLVADGADSPHTLLAKMKAAVLICIAQNDHEREPNTKAALEHAAAAAGVSAEVEVYPARHGWCTPDAPVYDEAQAERAWARLLATYAAHL